MDINILIGTVVGLILGIGIMVAISRQTAKQRQDDLAAANQRVDALMREAADAQRSIGMLRGAQDALERQHRELVEQHQADLRGASTVEQNLATERTDRLRAQDAMSRAQADAVAAIDAQRSAEAEGMRLHEIAEAQSLAAQMAQRELDTVKIERDKIRVERDHAQTQRDAAIAASGQASEARANAESGIKHADAKVLEMKEFLEQAQTNLSAAFTEMAGKAFAERTAQVEAGLLTATAKSKEDIDALLKPFDQRIGEFRQRVDQIYGDEAKERASLVGAVTKLEGLNRHIADQADQLTRALKGSAKVRGDWGELALDTVLTASGLIEGQHYARQVGVNTEEGGNRRPDVVVRLPGDRHIIIDAKALLNDWQAAMNADTDVAQVAHLQNHAAALRRHVGELSLKNYPHLLAGEALEFTIAFIPIEGALSAAIAVDPQLQIEAFSKRVALASPNTLIALLSLCGRIWQREQVQREADEITKLGGLLLTSVANFTESFGKVGDQMAAAVRQYENAKQQLNENTQSITARAKRLEDLGVKATKPQRKKRAGSEPVPVEFSPVLIELAPATATDDDAEEI